MAREDSPSLKINSPLRSLLGGGGVTSWVESGLGAETSLTGAAISYSSSSFCLGFLSGPLLKCLMVRQSQETGHEL